MWDLFLGIDISIRDTCPSCNSIKKSFWHFLVCPHQDPTYIQYILTKLNSVNKFSCAFLSSVKKIFLVSSPVNNYKFIWLGILNINLKLADKPNFISVSQNKTLLSKFYNIILPYTANLIISCLSPAACIILNRRINN